MCSRIMVFNIFSLFILLDTIQGATIYVPDNYPEIQQAIDAASADDTIIVRPGTYVENIDFIGKAIALTSELGSDDTIIDGNQAGSVVTCKSGEGADSVLEGFTITNGRAYNGGGMVNHGSSPMISDCTFSDNSTYQYYGHGYYGSYGGGMYNMLSAPTVFNCTFSSNWTNGTMLSGKGGGMYNELSSPTVTKCTFLGNDSGGMVNWNSSPMVTNCTFAENETHYLGGGVYNFGGSPMVTNCIFLGNQSNKRGGGMTNSLSDPTVINCTFLENIAVEEGGGISNGGGNPTVINSILWNNVAPEGPEIWVGDSSTPATVTISYSDVKGGKASCHVEPNCTLNWGPGMIDAAPLFVDEANGDFHLTFPSPCKDTGDSSVVAELLDFEGDPRIAYGTVDMGVDEFHTHLYWTGDAMPGGNVEVKLVGLPGTSPANLWIGSDLLEVPIPTIYGDWYLDFPILLTLTLGSIASPSGVTLLSHTFDPRFPAMDIPMQALIGMDLTNSCVIEVK